MKKVLAFVTLALAVAYSATALAGETCPMAAEKGGCGGDKGGCIWSDAKADFALATEGEALKLAVVVNGCAGKRSAFQQKLADELAKDAAGGGCAECPFSVPGLTFKAENTDLGATVLITGPADKRAEFKTRYDKKIAARTAGAAAGGCGCGHEKAAFGE